MDVWPGLDALGSKGLIEDNINEKVKKWSQATVELKPLMSEQTAKL